MLRVHRPLRRPQAPRRPPREPSPEAPDASAPPAGKLRVVVRAAESWLIVLGLAAIIIGGHDTVAGTDVTVRVLGTFVFGAGCVLVSGAIGLSHNTVRGLSLATVGALLGVALGALTLLAQVVNDEPDRRLVLWTAIMVLSAACAWVVREVTPPEARGGKLFSALPVLKSVVSIGLLVSVAQFWYTSIYIPTTAPASLTFEARIDQAPRGDDVAVTGKVTVRNTSGTRVNVLASTMRVAGETVQPGEAADFDLGVRDARQGGSGYATRFRTGVERTVVAEGQLLPYAAYLDAGETVTVPIVAWVPAGRFDLAGLEVSVVIARGRALALEDADAPETLVTPDGVGVITEIPEAGWLRRLTRGDRYVRADYIDGGQAVPMVTFVADADAEPGSDEDFNERLWRFYGTSFGVAEAKVLLKPQ